MTMSARLIASLVRKQSLRTCHCWRGIHGIVPFSSSQHDTGAIHVRLSLRGASDWENVVQRSRQLLDNKVDPRIRKNKLSEVMLECVEAETTDAGPMAGSLLEYATSHDQATAELMHMVRILPSH